MELLRLDPRPTAIISSNNNELLGLMRAISELHVDCPREVSVIGFDDSIWTMHFTPRLTVVAQPAYEVGKAAFEMLLAKMQAETPETQPQPGLLLLPAELRLRDSTAPPAV